MGIRSIPNKFHSFQYTNFANHHNTCTKKRFRNRSHPLQHPLEQVSLMVNLQDEFPPRLVPNNGEKQFDVLVPGSSPHPVILMNQSEYYTSNSNCPIKKLNLHHANVRYFTGFYSKPRVLRVPWYIFSIPRQHACVPRVAVVY